MPKSYELKAILKKGAIVAGPMVTCFQRQTMKGLVSTGGGRYIGASIGTFLNKLSYRKTKSTDIFLTVFRITGYLTILYMVHYIDDVVILPLLVKTISKNSQYIGEHPVFRKIYSVYYSA